MIKQLITLLLLINYGQPISNPYSHNWNQPHSHQNFSTGSLVQLYNNNYLQLAVLLWGLWTNTLVSKNSFVDLKHKGHATDHTDAVTT